MLFNIKGGDDTMSYYESPEQRRARELRERIRRLEDQKRKDEERIRNLINSITTERDRINREAKEKIRNAEQRAEEFSRRVGQMSSEIQELDRRVKEQRSIQEQKIRDIQNDYNNRINSLNSVMETRNADLQRQINRTNEEMRQEFANVRTEIQQGIDTAINYTNSRINELDEKFQSQIDETNGRINDIVQNLANQKEHEKELAEYWTEQAVRIREELISHRAEFHSNREFTNLSNRINNALNDYKTGDYSTAFYGGRDAFNDGLSLLESTIEAEMEWNLWFNMVKDKERDVLIRFSEAEVRTYEVEIDGEIIEDDSGIDYWTNNQLSVFKERFDCARESVRDLDQKDLNYLKDRFQEFQSLQEELSLIENTASINLGMAIDRREIAMEIGQALGEGYQMDECDGDYMGLEVNDEYHAFFKNPTTGDMVAVVVTPEVQDDGTVLNHVQMEIKAPTINLFDEIQNVADRKTRSIFDNPNPNNTFSNCSKPHGEASSQEVERLADIQQVREGKSRVRRNKKTSTK